MAEVSIDIAAMRSLVRKLSADLQDVPQAAVALNWRRLLLGLDPLRSVSPGGPFVSWAEPAIRDLNRRLSLAQMIQRSTPNLSVVSFDDKVLSKLTDAQIKAKVDRVEELLDDEGGDKPPEELLKILEDNSLDPYFAKALAERITPERLDAYMAAMETDYRSVPHADPSGDEPQDTGPTSWEVLAADYRRLAKAFGPVFGLASHGTGELAVPGLSKQWADVLRRRDGVGPNRLSMVIGEGEWSDDFLVDAYDAVIDAGGDQGSDAWAVDLRIFDGDPLTGVLRAMQLRPGAVRRIFAEGPRTTITVDGKKQVVNKAMYDVLRRPGRAAEELIAALQAGIAAPPVAGAKAWQPELAGDVLILGDWIGEQTEIARRKQKEAEEAAGPLWKRIGHGLLDLAGLVPVLGEGADLLNGVWYYADGDVINGSLSMASVIPFVGWAAQGGKWVRVGLKSEELVELTAKTRRGEKAQIFFKGSADEVLSKVDPKLLKDPGLWSPERFLSPREMEIWSGNRSFMQRVIAGNRFDSFAAGKYKFNQITLERGRVRGFRLDSYSPPDQIVSRKLTQLGEVKPETAKGYIDEFLKKYPPDSVIANTKKNRELGIAGTRLEGKMILEVPPQRPGPALDAIIKYAQRPGKKVYIRDVNGNWITPAPR